MRSLKLILVVVCVLHGQLVYAQNTVNAGVILSNTLKTLNQQFTNTVAVTPHLSFFFNTDTKLFISADIINENSNEYWNIRLRPGISELSLNLHDRFFVEIGRLRWKDVSALVADGIFDGILADISVGAGRFTAGSFYTGLVQKEQAAITMTAADTALYEDEENHYTPKKIMGILGGELAGIFGPKNFLNVTFMMQHDLAQELPLHTQYLILKFKIQMTNTLDIGLGSIMGLSQQSNENNLQMAAFGTLEWYPARKVLHDRLTLSYIWTSGIGENGFGRYYPITHREAGHVFPALLSNLARYRLSYSISGIPMFIVMAEASVFFRTSYELPLVETPNYSDSMFLGHEVYASINWQWLPHLSFDAGFGAFVPNDALYQDALDAFVWKLNLMVTANIP